MDARSAAKMRRLPCPDEQKNMLWVTIGNFADAIFLLICVHHPIFMRSGGSFAAPLRITANRRKDQP